MRMMRGDCLELLKDIPNGSVDMVLTDPPYGIDYQSCFCKTNKFDKILGDKSPMIAFIPMLKRLLKPTGCVMIFTRWDVQQTFMEAMNQSGMRVKNVIIWDKQIHGMGDLKRAYASSYESVLFHSENDFTFAEKRPRDIISVRKVLPKDLVHPNEKPVKLMETFINQCTLGGCAQCLIHSWAADLSAWPASIPAATSSEWNWIRSITKSLASASRMRGHAETVRAAGMLGAGRAWQVL